MDGAAAGYENQSYYMSMVCSKALSPVQEQFPQVYCYYMDDILVPAANKAELQQLYPVLQQLLATFGLCIAPEKIQQAPWKYFRVEVLDQMLEPQSIQLRVNVRTLNDLQKLLGTINWVGSYLGLTTEQLKPL